MTNRTNDKDRDKEIIRIAEYGLTWGPLVFINNEDMATMKI